MATMLSGKSSEKMPDKLPRALFVTGTDTDCGKTLVASAIMLAYRSLGYRVVGLKPVASGSDFLDGRLVNRDVTALKQAANVVLKQEIINPYIFAPPISPHFAARAANEQINLTTICDAFSACQAAADIVIVEGAGGWRVPLGDDLDIARLAKVLAIPIVVVSGLRLGCINHTLLTANDIRAEGCELFAWVANSIDQEYSMREETVATIAEKIAAPLLGNIPWLPNPMPQSVAGLIDLAQFRSI